MVSIPRILPGYMDAPNALLVSVGASTQGFTAQAAKHQYVDVGVGVAVR